MEKRTILAIVLSAAVLFGFQILNSYLYPTKEQVNNDIVQIENQAEENQIIQEVDEDITDSPVLSENIEVNPWIEVDISTDLYSVTFDTKGAKITSLKLLDHNVDIYSDTKVDLVHQKIENNSMFDISLGDFNDPIHNGIYAFKKISDEVYEFEKNFVYSQGGVDYPLTIIKTYTFNSNEYIFDLKVAIKNSNNASLPLNSDGSLYALHLGKQIGPEFKKLDRRDEYRRFTLLTEGKRKEQKVKKGESIFTEQYKWAAVEGKFFTVAILPENNSTYLRYGSDTLNEIPTSELTINRRGNSSSYIEDTYKIYAGPKDKKILSSYEGLDLDKIIHFNAIIKPLATLFTWILQFLYSFLGNYGFAIILLTVVIKAILYPFTKKSFESMGKMQTIQPKVQELQAKYKDDPNKLNAAMADLYKREGVNPLGGCLPMLLQMPIFITFYSLLNEFIGLRGATFIPGWINDLSKPEYILQFGFELPFLGWDALRLLPILYVTTQLLSMKFTQNNQKKSGATPQGASAMQQKMLTLGMPIMFFFIMYNQTSGLLLYWTTMNIIQSVQTIFGKKKSEKALEEEERLKLEKKKGKKRR